MSYTKLGAVVITDIAGLRKAVMKDKRLIWVEGATSYKHEYNERPCVHKIQVSDKGPGYEIGVIETQDGAGYNLIWDSSSGFERIIGKGACDLNTSYAREVSRDWAAKNGFTMTETTDKEGNLVIEMTN